MSCASEKSARVLFQPVLIAVAEDQEIQKTFKILYPFRFCGGREYFLWQYLFFRMICYSKFGKYVNLSLKSFTKNPRKYWKSRGVDKNFNYVQFLHFFSNDVTAFCILGRRFLQTLLPVGV